MRRSRNVKRTKRTNTRKRTSKIILRRSRRVKGVINRRKRNMNNIKNTVTKRKMRSRQKSKSKKIKRKILKGGTLKRIRQGGAPEPDTPIVKVVEGVANWEENPDRQEFKLAGVVPTGEPLDPKGYHFIPLDNNEAVKEMFLGREVVTEVTKEMREGKEAKMVTGEAALDYLEDEIYRGIIPHPAAIKYFRCTVSGDPSMKQEMRDSDSTKVLVAKKILKNHPRMMDRMLPDPRVCVVVGAKGLYYWRTEPVRHEWKYEETDEYVNGFRLIPYGIMSRVEPINMHVEIVSSVRVHYDEQGKESQPVLFRVIPEDLGIPRGLVIGPRDANGKEYKTAGYYYDLLTAKMKAYGAKAEAVGVWEDTTERDDGEFFTPTQFDGDWGFRSIRPKLDILSTYQRGEKGIRKAGGLCFA